MILTLRGSSSRNISATVDPQQQDELEDDIISIDGEGDDDMANDDNKQQQQPHEEQSEEPLTEEEKQRKTLLIGYARRLKRVQKLWGNETCADCYASGPKWASILLKPETEGKLGVLVCDMCAVHHYSEVGEKRVKLKYMDYVHEWSEEALTVLETSGNALVNSIYEANLTSEDYTYYYDPNSTMNYEEDSENETNNDTTIMNSDWRQAKFIKRKYKRDEFQDLDALEDALERVDKRISKKNRKDAAATYGQQTDATSTISDAPTNSELGSISLRGTAGETNKNANGNRRQSPLWNVFGLTRFNNKNTANNNNNSNTRSSFIGFRGLSTSLRGVAGEANSKANDDNNNNNNNNMKAREKLMKFFDVGMLELEDDYDIMDDDQALGYSQYDEEPVLYNDESDIADKKKQTDTSTDLITMANDILTKGATTAQRRRRCSSVNDNNPLQDIACKITGTTMESWADQEEELLDWIALTYPDINMKERKTITIANNNRRRRSSATSGTTTRRRRSSSRTNPTALQRLGTVSSDRDLRKASRANSSTRSSSRPSLHQASSESRLVGVGVGVGVGTATHGAGRERSQSRHHRNSRHSRRRHHSVSRLENLTDDGKQEGGAQTKERRARSKSKRRRHSVDRNAESAHRRATAAAGKERSNRSKSRRRRYSVDSPKENKALPSPLEHQQETEDSPSTAAEVPGAVSSEALEEQAKPTTSASENTIRRPRSKSGSRKQRASWSGPSMLTETPTESTISSRRRVSSSKKGTSNRRRSSGSRLLMSTTNDDIDPTLSTLDELEIAFLKGDEEQDEHNSRAMVMKPSSKLEQGLFQLKHQSKSARCVIDQTTSHDDEDKDEDDNDDFHKIEIMERCTQSCSDLLLST